jgi:hypothetical protein
MNGMAQRIKKEGLSTTIVQQAGSILLEVEKRDAPLSYRAPDNSSRTARLLFSLSNTFKLYPERAQARCL